MFFFKVCVEDIMAEASDALPAVSYAKIVDPAKEEDVNNVPKDNMCDKKPELDNAEIKSPVSEDDEGFQPVTDKKKEKQREREILREQEYRRKRNQRKTKFREKEKFRDKENDKENVDGFDSKEPSPPVSTKTEEEEEKEFVPAPPPKNNPWKKPAPTNLKSDNIENTTGDKIKPKVDKKKKVSDEDTKVTAATKPHSKQNPWKKVEVTIEPATVPVEDTPSSPKVIKEKRGPTWPKLGEESGGKAVKPSGGGKRVKGENWSGDSGAASSLETEEGRDHQVRSNPGPLGLYLILLRLHSRNIICRITTL